MITRWALDIASAVRGSSGEVFGSEKWRRGSVRQEISVGAAAATRRAHARVRRGRELRETAQWCGGTPGRFYGRAQTPLSKTESTVNLIDIILKYQREVKDRFKSPTVLEGFSF